MNSRICSDTFVLPSVFHRPLPVLEPPRAVCPTSAHRTYAASSDVVYLTEIRKGIPVQQLDTTLTRPLILF